MLTPSSESDYSSLLDSNKRDDDYVNATALCKAFNKEWRRASAEHVRIKELKALLRKDVPEKPATYSKGNQTYVHPILAIELARWLSPKFHYVVLDTFKRYLKGDVALATEIVSRSNDQAAVDRHIEDSIRHSQYLDTYHGMHGQLDAHGCGGQGIMHAKANKHINEVVGVESGTRATLSRRDKLNIMAAQAKAEVALMDDEEAEGWQAVALVRHAAINSMYNSQKRKELPRPILRSLKPASV